MFQSIATLWADEGALKRKGENIQEKTLQKRWESRTEITHGIVFVFRLAGHPGSYQLKSSQAKYGITTGSLLWAGGVQLHLPLYADGACSRNIT
jgi:hypothetical protein